MRICLTLLVVLFLTAPASAQEAFKQVWVTQSDSGSVVRGRMVELSPESLTVLTSDSRRVAMPIDKVLRIEAHGDSLKNGAGIGAAIMGGLSLLGCAAASDVGFCTRMSLFNVGFGALIGAGVDALNGGRSTLYEKAAPAKTAGVAFKLKW